MHRSLKRRIEDRTRPLAKIQIETGNDPKNSWQSSANISTTIASFIGIVALIFSGFQFKKSMEVQRVALEIQAKALSSERTAKAAESFQKFIEISRSTPQSDWDGKAKEIFRSQRDNKALQYLDALFTIGKDAARVKLLVASFMRPTAEYRCIPNAP